MWSYDFVKAMTHDGRALRIVVVIDEYTRECLALRVARRLGSLQVIDTLADVMLVRGLPEHMRSDNGPEFIAQELRKWLGKRIGPVTRELPLPNYPFRLSVQGIRLLRLLGETVANYEHYFREY